MSEELSLLLKHFKQNCSVKVAETLEENAFFHWKRLIFNGLDCDELLAISNYIKKYFSTEGKYTHKLPKLHSYSCYGVNCLCLTFHREQINEFLKK